MFRFEIKGRSGRVVLMDSVSMLAAGDEGAFVVSASHGGRSSGEIALEIPLAGAFFNAAGVGKDAAGLAALDMLEAEGVPAAAVDCWTARIGDARDMWDCGVVSHANQPARALGIVAGASLGKVLRPLVEASASGREPAAGRHPEFSINKIDKKEPRS